MTSKLKDMLSRVSAQFLKPTLALLAIVWLQVAEGESYTASQEFSDAVEVSGYSTVTGSSDWSNPVVFSSAGASSSYGLTVQADGDTSHDLALLSGYFQIASGTYFFNNDLIVENGDLRITGGTVGTLYWLPVRLGDFGVTNGTVNVGGRFTVAQNANSGSKATISGGTLNADQICLSEGAGANGSLNIDNGVVNVSGWSCIGSGSTSESVVNITDGNITFSGELWVGHGANSKTTVNMSGGRLITNSYLAMSRGDNELNMANSTNTFNLTGGVVSNFNANVSIGAYQASDSLATINVSGGELYGQNDIKVGEHHDGVLTVSGAGRVVTPASIFISEVEGNGTLNLNAGGTVVCGSVKTGTGTGTPTFNLNGGTLTAYADSDAFVASGISIAVGSNGGTIDTNGKEVTVASAITGDGTLYVKGGGKVTFTATPTCTVVVEGDTTAVDGSDNAIGIVQNTWRGASGAYWNVDSNWSAGSVPTADQIVKIDTDGTILISGWSDTDADACKAGALVIDANVVFSSTFKRPFIYGISGMTAISGSGTLTLTDNTGLENYSASVQEITCGLAFGTNSDHSWLGGSTYGWKVSGATTINSTVQTDQPAEFAGPMTIGENGVINTTGKAVTVTATSVVGSGLTFTGTGAVSIPISGSNVTIPAITTGGDLTVRGNGNVMVSGNISIAGVLTVSDVTLDAIGYNITASAVNLSASQIEGGHAGTVPAQTCVKANMIDAKVRGCGSVVTSGSVAAYGAGNFVGNIAANSLVKTDNGELVLFGTNAISGNITIGAGSMKLGDPLSLGTILYDFDVSAENAIETDENGAFLYVKAVNDNTLHLTSSGDEVPSIITDDQTSFGKRTYLKGNKLKLQAPTTGSGNTPTLLTTFLVWRVDSATDNYTTAMGDNYSGFSKYQIRCHNNKTKFVWRSYGGNDNWWDNNNCIWSNGQSGAPLIYTEQLMTVCGDEWLLRAFHPAYYGSSSKCSFAEVIGFNTKFTLDQRKAIEDYLMAKWGVNQTEYEVLSRSANILMSNGTALDLGGLSQTVTSVSVSGTGTATVQNGMLTVTAPISLSNGQVLVLPANTAYTLNDSLVNVSVDSDTGVITLSKGAASVGDTFFETVQKAIDALIAGEATGTLTIYQSATVNLSTSARTISDVLLANENVELAFTANLPWQGSYDASTGTIVNERIASTFVWAPQNDSTDWTTLANWKIGEVAATDLPGATDTVQFPSSDEPGFKGWTVTLAGNISVMNISVAASTRVDLKSSSAPTVRNVELKSYTCENTSTLGLSYIKILPKDYDEEYTLTIGGVVDIVDGTSNYILSTSSRHEVEGMVSKKAQALVLSADLTGGGYLHLGSNANQTRSGTTLSGNNAKFEGTVQIDGAGKAMSLVWQTASSGSASARWIVNQFDGKSLSFGFLNDTICFGSLEGTGTITLAANSSPSVQIGDGGDDSSCGFNFARGSSSKSANLVKTGSNKLSFAGGIANGNGNGSITIDSGILDLAGKNALPNSGQPITMNGGILAVTGTYPVYDTTDNGDGTITTNSTTYVYIDPSPYFMNQTTYPICFSNGVNEVHKWETALAVTNTKGLKKLGAGTLKLSYAPAYAGFEITVAENGGSVVLPKDANITLGKFTKVDSETDTTKTLVYYKAAATVEDVAVEYGADFATATVTVALEGDDVNGKEYTLMVGDTPYNGTAANGTVTFTDVATGHSQAYDSFEYALSSDTVTVSGGNGSKAIADSASWFSTGANGSTEQTSGGSWSKTMTWTDGKTTFDEDGSTFTATDASSASKVEVKMSVCFGNANDEAIDLGNANAAVKVATVNNALVFQALNNGEFVTLNGLTPTAEATYKVVLCFDYTTHKYTVTIDDTPLEYNGSTELGMSSESTGIQSVAFKGVGSLASLAGTQTEGCVAMDAEGTRYLTLEAAMEAAANDSAKLPLTVLHDGTYNGATYAKGATGVPSGASIVAADQTTADAAAAKMSIALTSAQVQQGLKTAYYKAVATEKTSGTYEVSFELADAVKPTVADEESTKAMETTTSAVALHVTNTKGGLYYGIAAGTSTNLGVDDAAELKKCETDGEDIGLTATLPESGVKYYKVIVSDSAPSSN